jgi:superfamily II DNA or RNA helicase
MQNHDLPPYELVTAKYGFPFEGRPKQIAAINDLAPLPRTGWWAETATGKTFMGTVAALYKKETGTTKQWIVLMPPILVKQWHKWLTEKVRGTSAVMYKGPPKKRRALKLDADFILMSIQVFKNDWDHLYKYFEGKSVGVIVDEATSIKNVGSDNYKAVRDFVNVEPA